MGATPDKGVVGFDGEVFGDKRFSYTQLNGVANQEANGLGGPGHPPGGDKVSLPAPIRFISR